VLVYAGLVAGAGYVVSQIAVYFLIWPGDTFNPSGPGDLVRAGEQVKLPTARVVYRDPEIVESGAATAAAPQNGDGDGDEAEEIAGYARPRSMHHT
jgi:hypothetical protein